MASQFDNSAKLFDELKLHECPELDKIAYLFEQGLCYYLLDEKAKAKKFWKANLSKEKFENSEIISYLNNVIAFLNEDFSKADLLAELKIQEDDFKALGYWALNYKGGDYYFESTKYADLRFFWINKEGHKK